MNSAQKDSATGHEKNMVNAPSFAHYAGAESAERVRFFLHFTQNFVGVQDVVNYLVLKDRQLYFFR